MVREGLDWKVRGGVDTPEGQILSRETPRGDVRHVKGAALRCWRGGPGFGEQWGGDRSLAKDRFWKAVTPFVTMIDSIPPQDLL